MTFGELGLVVSLAVLAVVLSAPLLIRLRPSALSWQPSIRRTVWISGMCAAVALVAQAWVVHRVTTHAGPTVVDQVVLRWFVEHRVGWATVLGRVLALIGGPGAMALLVTVAAVVLWTRRHRAPVFVLVATGAAAVAMTHGFKAVYARARPPLADQVIPYTNNALPSGHALGSTVVVGTLAAVCVSLMAGRGARAGVLGGAGLFVLAVGVSRLYLAAHWFTDVLAGWLLGGVLVAVGVAALALSRATGPAADGPQPVSPRTSHTTTPPRS